MYNESFMRRAIDISATALDKPGTEPFGAVIVRNGEIVGEGLNHSRANFDPTSHGETEAIRDACRNLGTLTLAGCDLYTSCEPCSLCVAAMTIAGIDKLYYAASLAQSGEAFATLRGDDSGSIDVHVLRVETGSKVHDRRMPAEQAMSEEAVDILERWAKAQ